MVRKVSQMSLFPWSLAVATYLVNIMYDKNKEMFNIQTPGTA